MNRPVSPLLHDYKQSTSDQPKKSKALQWFTVGLGISLIVVALVNTVDMPAPGKPPSSAPVMVASIDESSVVPPVDRIVLMEQAEALMPAPAPAFKQLVFNVAAGDTIERLFRQNNLDIGQLMLITELEEAKTRFRRIKPGDVFEVNHKDGQIMSLYTKIDLTSALKIEKQESGFAAEIIDQPIERRKRMAYGVIASSLFESAAAAGLSDKVIMNIAGIFAWDVDFVLDIRQGDNYYVQFEEIWQDGKYVSDGEIIAAEFNNNGRTIQAIRFVDDNERSEYFTPNGDSVRKAFIRAPVDFTRISSNFNPNRKHPILNTIRAHRGVDYAAPRGTTIKASGDGKVIFRGTKSGYGKTVIVQHGGNITTLYAHMSSYVLKVGVGTRVRQGQAIGFVGSTGLATANHLHYEYRLNGVHRNPRTVSLPDAEPIDEQYRDTFMARAAPIMKELEQFKSTQAAAVAYNSQ
ncbi:MAG: peptidoglycan DD-metalloendopeptidase family protein [Woeseiaceae bacterium]|nr:peptidoglycan DD-metalloendopeptidase family protein [Woeseiaceae bacterium]